MTEFIRSIGRSVLSQELRNTIVEKAQHLTTPYYVVSFPKSGRTWIRVFLSKYFSELYGTPLDIEFSKVIGQPKNIPRIVFTHKGHNFEDRSTLSDQIARLQKKKILFLIRDPRDIVISYYFQTTRRRGADDVPKNLSEFIRHKKYGISQVVWFINEWYEKREDFQGFEVVVYRNCKKDPHKEFSRILRFLNISVDNDKLDKAIKFSSFRNMRELEKKDAYKSDVLRPGDPKDEESYKVRKGKVGGFVDYLDAKDISYLATEMEKLSPDLRRLFP